MVASRAVAVGTELTLPERRAESPALKKLYGSFSQDCCFVVPGIAAALANRDVELTFSIVTGIIEDFLEEAAAASDAKREGTRGRGKEPSFETTTHCAGGAPVEIATQTIKHKTLSGMLGKLREIMWVIENKRVIPHKVRCWCATMFSKYDDVMNESFSSTSKSVVWG